MLVYSIVMLLATVTLTKRENSKEGFFVGNRKVGRISSAMSIAATWIWAPALFTSAEKAYLNGWAGLFWFLVPNVICLILFIPFAKKIRKAMPEGITLSGFMAKRYQSKKVKNIYLFQLILLAILSSAVQLLAGGKILSTITGIPFWSITVLLSVIAFSYSQFSGIRASVVTDMVQMIFMLIVCFIFVPWALSMNQGVNSLARGLTGITGDYTGLFDTKGLEVFFSFGLPTAIGLIAGPFGDQCFWQRAFSIEENKIGKAFLIGAVLFSVIPFSMGILGFIAAGSGYVPTDTGVVNFELVRHLFPDWCMGLFLFMVVSGLLSTLDSNLCAIASLTTDMTKGKDSNYTIRFSKYMMVLLLLAGILIANRKGLTVTNLFLIYGTLRAATLLPTVMTLLNKKLSPKGVFYGILISLLIGFPIFAYGTVYNLTLYKTAGSLVTVLAAGIVALFISRKRSSLNEVYFRKETKYKK